VACAASSPSARAAIPNSQDTNTTKMQLTFKKEEKKASTGKQAHKQQWMQTHLRGRKKPTVWQPVAAAGREGVK